MGDFGFILHFHFDENACYPFRMKMMGMVLLFFTFYFPLLCVVPGWILHVKLLSQRARLEEKRVYRPYSYPGADIIYTGLAILLFLALGLAVLFGLSGKEFLNFGFHYLVVIAGFPLLGNAVIAMGVQVDSILFFHFGPFNSYPKFDIRLKDKAKEKVLFTIPLLAIRLIFSLWIIGGIVGLLVDKIFSK